MVKSKIIKALTIFAIASVVIGVFCVSSSAIGASWGVSGYTATSTMPLKSIRVNDTKGIYSQYDDNESLFFCLADYMQYTRMQDLTRYSIQVPPYPQFNGNPGSTINNFMVYNNIIENNGYHTDIGRVYCNNTMLPSNSSERYYVNPFNSKVIQFKFDDFAIFDDQDDVAYGSYWFYHDNGSVDYYTVTFNVKFFDDYGRFVNEASYSINSDINIKFSHDEYDRADGIYPDLVALFDYYNFNQIIGDVGTYGYYISDLTFTVYHSQVTSDVTFCDYAGYESSLIRDTEASSVESFISANLKQTFVGIGDISFTDWLETAVGGFFDFEIIPNVSLGGILLLVVSVGILMLLIRIFRG